MWSATQTVTLSEMDVKNLQFIHEPLLIIQENGGIHDDIIINTALYSTFTIQAHEFKSQKWL